MPKRIVIALSITLVLWLGGWNSLQAQRSADTPLPPTVTATVEPTMTPSMAVEVRQPQQPPQSFWEKYGLIALVLSGVIGGILTLVFSNLLGPTFQHWGERLKEKLKGEGGRFLERYIPALAEEHRYLKLVGIYGKEWITRPPLKEVYVSLHMGSAGAGDDAALDGSLTVAQAMKKHDMLLVLGEPGAGKSTLLDWLALVFCGEIEQQALQSLGDLLPIYLPLRTCAGDDRPLHELMSDPALLPLSHVPPQGFFQERLNKGGCLVLLDGLDEVVDRQARDRAADKINRLVRAFPKNRYAVTCRTAGWEEGLLTGEFTRLLIRDFSEADTHRFVAGWYRAVRSQEVLGRVGLSEEGRERALVGAQRRAATEAQALMDALAGNLSLSELARNPLILSLIALVHYRRRDLPQGRTKLYQECLEILLDVWDREDKELDLKALSLNAKETILRRVAYHFHSQGLTEAGGEELESLIAPLLPELDCTLSPSGALRQIEERSGILVARALDRYTFAHRTLQEYLTAKVLAAVPDRYYELVAHLRDEPWREVILLYVGLVEDATPLVQALLSESDDAQCNLLFLAGQCLIEDVRVDEAVRAKVVTQLDTAFRETSDALTMERLGRTLAAIGGGDVVALFGRVLSEGAPPQRAGAARALGRLGAGRSDREPVAALLAESLAAAQPPVRRAAALALADLGHKGQATLAALERARQAEAEELRAAALWALLKLDQV
jgi:energy-coupling factor transporter ATP-binding protein EcfA2